MARLVISYSTTTEMKHSGHVRLPWTDCYCCCCLQEVIKKKNARLEETVTQPRSVLDRFKTKL